MKHIYYLTYGEYELKNYTKIGEAKNLDKRLTQLLGSVPEKKYLVLSSTVDINISDRDIHNILINKMSIKRIHNEWFECTLEQFFKAISIIKKDKNV